MFVNRRRIVVEFADCDPAQIVFYANYFRWFDDCTTALFAAAGLPINRLFKFHGVIGIPIVDAHARFLAPSTYGDEIDVESSVVEWRRSSFVISHKFFRQGKLLLEGQETRVWAAAVGSNPHQIKGVVLPSEVISKLSKKGRKKAARTRRRNGRA